MTLPKTTGAFRNAPTQAEIRSRDLAVLEQRREAYIQTHPLVYANPSIDSATSVAERLALTKHFMAREVAGLEFNRSEKDRDGKDSTAMSSRIVTTLQRMAAIDLEITKVGTAVVDPHSDEVQKMVAVIIGRITNAVAEMAKSGLLPEQTMDMLTNKMAQSLEGWEDEV